MSTIDNVNYDKINQDKLRTNIKYSDFEKAFNKTILQNETGNIVLLEIPAEKYIETNINSVKSMINHGFEGIYLSFQRPYNNLSSILKNNDVDLTKLFIIECATSFCGEKPCGNPGWTGLSQNFEVEETINAILTNLSKLKSDKKFVFIDSLTTLALHESFFDTSRFTNALIESIKDNDFDNITIIFNVAKNLEQKNLIENFMVNSDDYTHLVVCK
jgi:hypothetical protein